MDTKKYSLINNIIAIGGAAGLYALTSSLWSLIPLIMLTWVTSKESDKE